MARALQAMKDLFVRKDVIVLTLGFMVVGALMGWFVLPEAWGPFWRLAAGVTMGFNGVLYVVGPRMIGGKDFD